jgi:nucleotide-binding universal stress UspA family protein
MPGLFKNILIPVDFSVNTEVAVKHAIELTDASGSSIHLLHVVKPKNIWNKVSVSKQPGSSLSGNHYENDIIIKLQEWKHAIEESIQNSNVTVCIVEGAVHNSIADAAKQIKPQLLIIGKKNNSGYFTFFNTVDPNGLAKSTGCPVLTAMQGAFNTKTKIIVVPVGSIIPKRKIELVVVFAEKYRAKIHLVAMQNKMGAADIERKALLDTYRILKTGLPNPIEYHLLNATNFTKATLDYAECIGADIVFVSPETETKISNFTGKHINDVLASTSKLKILSVEPYSDS